MRADPTDANPMIQSDLDLFGPQPQRLASHTVLLPGFALAEIEAVLDALRPVLRAAPFRHMRTPGGLHMAVALTNCGAQGWVSDEQGYRYSPTDPKTGLPWPAMPQVLLDLADRAACAAGFDGFVPDACLINHYVPGTRLTLHGTVTSAISASRSCRCPWDYQRCFSSVDCSARTGLNGYP